MDDYGDDRSYGSYLSRVFAIIVAFLLLVAAIWFVVKLASNDTSETLGDSTTINLDHGGIVADNDSGSGAQTTDDNGFTLSTNTDVDTNNGGNVAGINTEGLPNTGASMYSVLLVGMVVFAVAKVAMVKSNI